MRDLLIDLNSYFSKYKYTIGFIIVVIILVFLVAKEHTKLQKKVGDSRAKSTISESVSNRSNVNDIANNNEIKSYEDVKKYVKNNNETIYAFYLLCKEGNTSLAYEALSDECKEILYPTLKDFEDNYYSAIFKTNKDCNIASFKNNTYKVDYTENAINTGNTKSIGITDYITIADDGKLNISGLISREKTKISSVQSYFSTTITEKQTFVDSEIYTIVIGNNVKADLYMNDSSESGLYLLDTYGKAYYVESEDYFDVDYYVPSESKKMLKLKFRKKYSDDSETSQICFNNIKVENKRYYDNTSAEKYTMYPEKTNAIINIM